jgi:hypothetical protein
MTNPVTASVTTPVAMIQCEILTQRACRGRLGIC